MWCNSPQITKKNTDSLLHLLILSRLKIIRSFLTKLKMFISELLSLEGDSQGRINFIKEMKNVTYQQLTLITSMETLKKDSDDADALTLLVIGE